MDSGSSCNPTTESIQSTTSINSVRQKTDITWNHCVRVGPNCLKCLYCSKVIKGGGIHRIKEHLGKQKGSITSCSKVPAPVQYQMECALKNFNEEKRKKQRNDASGSAPGDNINEQQMHGLEDLSNTRESRGNGFIGSFFPPRTTPGSQPTIKSIMASKDAVENADMMVAKWFFDACIPFNAINSPYFQDMLDAVTSIGPGYKAPSYDSLRSSLLNKHVSKVNEYLDSFKQCWEKTGCTIMSDGWTDQNGRTLINFRVYCPKGLVFLKSIDASEHSKTAELLFQLFKEVVEMVGSENVVQVVTDNAANYVATGRLLTQEFPTMYWTPCAAHCIDLMLEDFAKLDPVKEVIGDARMITKFIYNHQFVLHLMRKFTHGELLRPGATRFATNFIALQSLVKYKDSLRAMVTSREWLANKFPKSNLGIMFTELVLSSIFWASCEIVIKVSKPLVVILRMVDSKVKPAMGYIHQGLKKAREAIKFAFRGKRDECTPYLKIMDNRWDIQLYRPLHSAGFWFNPEYFYDPKCDGENAKVFSDVLDCMERMFHDNEDMQLKINKEFSIYREATGDFGRNMAIKSRNTLLPVVWWQNYGGSAPNLQKMVIRVLRQTCSSSSCERNWSVFERIHTKKRNRLEHKRLNDLVFVQYNLRLQTRGKWKEMDFDPISFEDMDVLEDWVTESEVPLLNEEDVDSWLEMDATFEGNTMEEQEQVNEGSNLDGFNLNI